MKHKFVILLKMDIDDDDDDDDDYDDDGQVCLCVSLSVCVWAWKRKWKKNRTIFWTQKQTIQIKFVNCLNAIIAAVIKLCCFDFMPFFIYFNCSHFI